MKLLYLTGTGGVQFQYRAVIPGAELKRTYGWDVRAYDGPCPADLFDRWAWTPDMIILQTVKIADLVPVVAEWKAKGIKIIYDLDDDLWNSPRHGDFDTSSAVELINQSVAVITASDTLNKLCKSWNDKVITIPNYLPDEYFKMADKAQKVRVGRKVVAFIGGPDHEPDLALVAPVLMRLKEAVPGLEILLIGCVPEWAIHLKAIVVKRVSPSEFWPVASGLDVDCAIAPLADTAFNRARSYLKLLEYGALRFPVVASDVGEFQKFRKDCVVVGESFEAWYGAILRFLSDKPNCDHWALQLRTKTECIGKISHGVQIWKNVLENL